MSPVDIMTSSSDADGHLEPGIRTPTLHRPKGGSPHELRSKLWMVGAILKSDIGFYMGIILRAQYGPYYRPYMESMSLGLTSDMDRSSHEPWSRVLIVGGFYKNHTGLQG